MNWAKKIVFVITICIFIYILWRLISRQIPRLDKGVSEGFSFTPTPDSDLVSMKNTDSVKILNIDHSVMNLPIIEYAVKGSYNSGCTGYFINKDAIKYVLARGCRYIDLEISLVDGVPSLVQPNDPSLNTLSLNDALTTISINAFNSSISPNFKDPLFLNLRVDASNPTIYPLVAKSVESNMSTRLYKKKITNKTKLSEVAGSVVLLVDRTIDLEWKKKAACDQSKKTTKCYDLTTYMNMESGSEDLLMYYTSDMLDQYPVPVYVKNDNVHTNVEKMYLINPHSDSNANITNTELYQLMMKHGCQIIPFCFYMNDANLAYYESVFNDNKSAFVPMHALVTYYKNKV